jgi:hypothetical protein
MSDPFFDAMAEALEAAAAVFRRHSALADADSSTVGAGNVVSRARAVHPLLGPRQAEILGLLEEAGRKGTNTGVLSRAMEYDQPNVYLTLRGLIGLGFVEKDETTSPHTYRLTDVLWGDSPPA